MADATGAEVGYVIYDGFGGVLTSTLSLTLTGSLPDMPDAATGLVHLGGGRYYDPAIGRPLQPNTAGAPPTMPQALNRYTAAAAGQPGVGQSGLVQAATNDPFNWTPHIVNLVENTALELRRKAPAVTGRIYEGVRPVAVSDSRHTLTHHLPDALQEFPGRFTGSNPNDMFYRTTMRVRADSELRIGVRAREMATEVTNAMPPGSRVQVRGGLDGHNWVIGPTRGQLEDVARLDFIRTGLGLVLDFGLGFGFQFIQDYQNPYLSSGQVIVRASISGAGGATFAYVTGLVICGVSGGIGCLVLAGTAGGLIWSVTQPHIFSAIPGIQPTRNLRPLVMPQ